MNKNIFTSFETGLSMDFKIKSYKGRKYIYFNDAHIWQKPIWKKMGIFPQLTFCSYDFKNYGANVLADMYIFFEYFHHYFNDYFHNKITREKLIEFIHRYTKRKTIKIGNKVYLVIYETEHGFIEIAKSYNERSLYDIKKKRFITNKWHKHAQLLTIYKNKPYFSIFDKEKAHVIDENGIEYRMEIINDKIKIFK